jgi:hypothetical protein
MTVVEARRTHRTPPGWVLACGLVGVVVLSYVSVRAWRVPLTYDEAASYYRYVVTEPLAIFDFSVATNHFLNSLLTRATASAHGTPFALRLPNVAAAAIYLLACLGIVSFLENPFTRVGGFVVLATNLYLLDYLALSRGYGLSVALFTASTYFLLRSALDESSSGRSRAEQRALALAALAVVASFSALPACLAVGAVVGLRPAGRRFTTLVGPSLPSLLPRTAHLLAWVMLATTFTALVLNRDTALSDRLYEPVSVRIAGLFADELNDVEVYRATAKGYWEPLARGPRGVWRTRADHVRDLRVDLPAQADRNMTTLEVLIGSQRFLRTRAARGPWQVADVGSMRRLDATPELSLPRSSQPHLSGAINWGGDAGHRRVVAAYTLVGLALLSVVAAATYGAAALAAGRAIVDPLAARGVSTMVLWLLPFVSAPVYLLRLHGELYYGGTHGLVRDTLGSLVQGTYYGAQYHPEQITWGLTVLGTSTAMLAAVLVGSARSRALIAGRIGVVLLAVLTAAALQLWIQRLWLGTPYLLGRTALWLVPLLCLVPIVLSEVVSSMSRHHGRLLASTAAVTMAVAASWHAVNHANLTHVVDWPRDGDTPAMLEAVVATIASTRPRPPVVRIGVEWPLYPVARYYAALHSTAVTRYDIHVVTNTAQTVDFLYTAPHSPWARGDAIARYPTADAVLTRTPAR